MIYGWVDRLAKGVSPSQLAWLYRHAPASLVDPVVQSRFGKTVRWAAKHSPFYRRRFAELGINPNRVKRPEDLGDFYTLPDDLVANPTDFIASAPSIVFESSGTSGKNKQVYYDRSELEEMGEVMAAGFQLMGLRKDDRIANAFDFSIWIPGMITHYGLMAAGNFCLAFGKVDPIEVYRRLEQYKFTAVIGEPTWLIRLTELAEKHGRYPLRYLIGGAEEMPADAIPWMEKVWAPARVKMCYGSVELGSALAFQPCDQTDGYHLDHTDFLPELFEPDAEGYGEVVFTTLRRRVMPLIRYRTRDVAKIITEPCPCGIPAPRLTKLRGRRDEMVVASGGNLYPKMFETILSGIPGLSHDWQIIFRLEGIREILEIHVETQREDLASLEREIHASAQDHYPDLMKNLALGIFQMTLIPHAPGTLRSGRKLKRMVDRRHFDPTTPTSPTARKTADVTGE